MVNSNVTTITLNGGEIVVEFSSGYPYYFITNKSDTDMYVSMHSNITPKAEGVYTIAAGSTERIGSGYPFTKFYILGSGEAQIRGEQIATPPSFKQVQKGGDEAYEFEKNFSSHNLLAGFDTNTDICTKTQNGENVTYTIAANKAAAWYYIATLITVKRGKMYKLSVDKFNGYGRLAISSYSNGSENPYGSMYTSRFNLNAAGNFTDDNTLISFDNASTKYFYVVNPSSEGEIKIGIWICTDINRDGINGTEAHSFDIGLYEEV